MPTQEFYSLGREPDSDATRVISLHADPGVDDNVVLEFEATVRAYREASIADAAARLALKYGGIDSEAIGALLVVDGEDIGMAFCGTKDFVDPSHAVEGSGIVEGVNVSGWVLAQHRGRGYGSRLLAHITDCARQRVNSPRSAWAGRTIWTSIRASNVASQAACTRIGFVELGVQPDRPERLVYTLDTPSM